MKELIASGDPVLLSALRHHLAEEEIEFDIFDGFVGALFPGEMSVASSRVMVADDDISKAQTVLKRLQQGDMACE